MGSCVDGKFSICEVYEMGSTGDGGFRDGN